MRRMLPLGALMAALALTLSGTGALAQEASPEAPEESPAPVESPVTEPGTEPGVDQPAQAAHPAHIHFGSCEELGDVAFPLSHVSSEMLVDGEPGAGDQVGATMVDPAADTVLVSVTTVQAPLTDITGGEHAINVHESDEAIDTYIACGAIAGSLIFDSGLAIRLHEQSDSGHSGVAWLAQADEGSTAVYVFLFQDGATADGPMEEDPAMDDDAADADPAASPEPDADDGMTPDESPAA